MSDYLFQLMRLSQKINEPADTNTEQQPALPPQ